MPLIDLSIRSVDPLASVVAAWTSGALHREQVGDLRPDLQEYRVSLAGEHVGYEVAHHLAPDAGVYGSGESFVSLDLRGQRRVLVNREAHGASGVDVAYLNVPFFWSNSGWSVLLETGAPVLADIGASEPDVARFLVLGERAAAIQLAGTPSEMIGEYTRRTGRVGDWPDWAFGTWMSRATYVSAAEMHQTLEELQRAECPVSVMHVDAWMTGNVFREFTCNWAVDRERFPLGWTDALRARGARVSMWLNPFILAGSPLGTELRDAGLVLCLPDGQPAATSDRDFRYLVDFTNPAAVAWWQARVRQLLIDERPDALKLDFAEEVPLDAVCHDGRRGLDVRNSYAMLYQRATAEAIPAERRPMPFFCRSGCSGSQAYPCHWVGDTPSTWDAMKDALTACLSLSASGFALVSHDAGGFWSPGMSGIPGDLLDGVEGAAQFTADVEPELFGRWAQWAAFSPVTRFHGLGFREPTAYPEPWRSAAIDALQFRQERLIPSLRAALRDAQQTGMPIMRPMALAYPGDRNAVAAPHQYFLGPDILVAPVLERGGRADVWFPPGEWIPILGANAPQRSGFSAVTVAPNAFPVYARAGWGTNLPST